jgi:16S rRNA (cytosine1402-N4)-methyltransferase
MQLDEKEKGFSFSKEGPLDMRMDPQSSLTAEEIVNHFSEDEIGKILREYGEEPRWRRAAKAIVIARKKQAIRTTKQLAEIITSVLGFSSKKRLHPATLIFQGLRICVNRELESLEEGLKQAIRRLSRGGRIGVISFHRLEDRIVKTLFKVDASIGTKDQRKKGTNPLPLIRLLNKKPLVPTLAEIHANPRSRSAKLRFAEKL